MLNRYRNTSSVGNMLETLGWPTLQKRRQTSRLTMLHKIHNGLVHCPGLRAKLVPLPPRQRRGHDNQFTLITCRTQYRGSSFMPRTVKEWNQLPQETVSASTVDTFVSRAAQSQ